MDISVILPTYCECGNIEQLITAIEDSLLQDRDACMAEIIVVDDNSPDGTAQVVQTHQPRPGVTMTCLIRTAERGLATAIKYGILHSTGDRIVVMDTDFNHSPSNLPEMIHLLDSHDLVVGSRFVKGGGMEDRARYRYSQLYNLFIQSILWQDIRDSLSGFFAMRRTALLAMDLDRIFTGYGEYFIRLTYLARRCGLNIIEVPVFYTLRKSGFSKSNFTRMIRDYTLCAINLRIKS